jgi:hypothetical protein
MGSGLVIKVAISFLESVPRNIFFAVAGSTKSWPGATEKTSVFWERCVGITSSWCYPMSAPPDKAAGTATDFLAYCHTYVIERFFGACDGEKILVKEFSSGQLSH